MNPAEFEAALQRDGYTEITTKSLPHAPPNTKHAHDFDVRALVLEGAITLTANGDRKTYQPGEVFVMKRGCEHTEAVGAAGVRYVFGRRHVAAQAADGGGEQLHSIGPEDEARGGHEAPGEP